jgi:hypothetical protein
MPSDVTSEPLLLLDENLNRRVADALRLVEYNATSVHDVFKGQLCIIDPIIISWCENNKATWITTDI